MRYTVSAPDVPMHAAIRLPASKSISNRALILHALAHGRQALCNLSDCDDTRVMVRALQGNPEHIDIMAAGTAMRFLTAYLSVNAYYLMAPEMELSHGYCDLFLMPDLMRYEVKHSYILELKYLSVKDTEEKTRTQWQEAVKQINEYAAAPRVRQLVQNTKLYCIIIQFRGWELERMEEV